MSTITPDRLTAVDLTALPNDHMAALRREAIRRGVSLAELVAGFVNEASTRLVTSQAPVTASHHDPNGRAAYAAGRGLEMPKPEGSN
jgi:hypothetical protein